MDLPAVAVSRTEELRGLIGAELPPTPWLAVEREHLALFDEATFDGPSTNYVGAGRSQTVHGTHTVSLLVPLWERTVGVRCFSRVALYGLERVRFPASSSSPASTAARNTGPAAATDSAPT